MNAKDGDGKTGFHFACRNGHVEIIELLIKNSVECNINLNAKDGDNKTGLHYEDRDGKASLTGFHNACKRGHIKIVELLIKNSVECKINLNAKNGDGMTGFHYAFESGRIELVKVLIKNTVEFNIDLNVKDRDGKTVVLIMPVAVLNWWS